MLWIFGNVFSYDDDDTPLCKKSLTHTVTIIHQIYRETVEKLALEISSRQAIFNRKEMVKCSTHPLFWPILLLYWSIDFFCILYFTDRQDRSPFPIQTVSAKMAKAGLALGRSSVSWTFKLSRDSQEYLKNYWACTAQYALCAVWLQSQILHFMTWRII